MRDWDTGVYGFVRERRGIRALASLAARGAFGVTLAALALAAWLSPLSATHAASPVSIDIQNPQPSNGVAQGPILTNILVQGQAPANDTVTIGYAAQSIGCQAGIQPIPSTTLSVPSSGNFTVDFPWPPSANTVNAQYYMCAKDVSTGEIGQSPSLFRVVSPNAPNINIQASGVPNAPTAVPGTPTPAPTATAQSGQAYAGGYLQISGSNFLPGGQHVLFFQTAGQFSPAAYNPNDALPVLNGVAISDSSGSFQVVVKLPQGVSGSLVISAVSQDGSDSSLPSLVASQSVTMVAAPATPTLQPTVSPTASSHQNHNTQAPKQTVSPLQITGLVGLGVLSVILFIIGVGFLVSASSLPKP